MSDEADKQATTVRRARAEDADVVADMLDEALAEKFRPAFGANSLDAVRAFVRSDIRIQPERRFVAEQSGVVVGTVSLSIAGAPTPALVRPVFEELGALAATRAFVVLSTLGTRRLNPGDAWVEELAVAVGARRRGIARSLLETCEREARRRGCGRLCLNVTSDNEPALALYESFGLTIERHDRWRARRFIFGAPGSLMMRRRLA